MAVHVTSTYSGERWCYSMNNHHFQGVPNFTNFSKTNTKILYTYQLL